MTNNESYVDYLGIDNDTKLMVNGVESKIEMKGLDVIWIINDIKTYIISNVAGLLMVKPEFDDVRIQTKIEAIKTRDEAISIVESDLIGDGKPYVIADGKVWHSLRLNGVDAVKNEDTDNFYPGFTFLTSDVTNFKPLNKHFSKDSGGIIYHYYRLQIDNSDDFEVIGDTFYGIVDDDLYCRFNKVEGVDISDGISIISKEKEIIRDSKNKVFYGHKNVEVKDPDNLKQSCNHFFFDGINLYLVCGIFENVTEEFGLEEGKNMQHIEGNIYKVGDKTIEFEENPLTSLKVY